MLLLASMQAAAAGRRTIRWIASVYSDAKGSSLEHPEGVACNDEYFVLADTGNSRLLRYSYDEDGVVAEAEFLLPKSYPIRVQLNSKDEIYFLDGRERRIALVSAAGEDKGFLRYKGLPVSTEVAARSLAIDKKDNIYVLDIYSENVLVVDADGLYLRHVSFPEKYGFFTDIAVDRQGNILLLDGVEAVVYSAAPAADHFSPLTENMKMYMNFPTSLSVDDEGVMYLVDQYGSGLALVGHDGAFLGRKLGLGWKDGALYYPSQACVSRNGNLFIADRNNSRAQRFTTGAGKSGDAADEPAVDQ